MNTNRSARTRKTRRLLEAADAQLADARRHLTADSPRYAPAAASLVDVVETSVRAFLAWHGGDWLEGASLARRAEWVVSLASILRTPLRRARRIVPVAERLRSADGEALSVKDREAVLEGFYAVRNLYFTLHGTLPSAAQPDLTLPANAAAPAAGRRAMAHAA